MNSVKKIIFALSCVICLAACGNNEFSESEKTFSSEEVSVTDTTMTSTTTATATVTTTAVITTAAAEVSQTTEIPFYFGNENEVPENAAYKRISKTYDKDGKLKSRDIFFYDDHDNVIFILYQTNPESDKPSRITYTYEYDPGGRLISEDMDGIVHSTHTDYEYNPDGTVKSENRYNNDELWGSMEYFYDGHSEPIRIETYFTSDGGFISATDYEYEYDSDGRVIEKRTLSKTTSYESVEKYEYDENGHIMEWKRISDNNEHKEVYTYDTDNRKIKVEYYQTNTVPYYIEHEYEDYREKL